MMKFHISTFGCQMNEHDTEKIIWVLEKIGYQQTNNRNEADIIIFNTCAVRKTAEDRVFGQLGELQDLKRKNPDLIIAVCGCLMQKEEIRDYFLSKHKHIDIVFGTNNIHKLPQLIDRHLRTGDKVIDVIEDTREISDNIDSNRKYSYKAFVDIMYGCNNFCSYCIVPYTRGRERSRSVKSIINEVENLAQTGCKEITLLGQNVNSYGKTLEEKTTFSQLLALLNKIEGIERIRFMTSHPKDFSDELIEAYKSLDKLCNHLHLPVQSGSNRILKLMNRNYTKEQYLERIYKLREEIPDIAITTDIIVGFPGETEEDFEETLDLIKKAKFDSAFTFLYSIREGTNAAKMTNQIPDEIKHDRFQRLLDVLYPIGLESNKRLIKTVQKVLVEEISKNDENILSGRTECNKLVHFKGSRDIIGQIVDVEITNVKTFTLEGRMV
ncbi:tRNA (N6-isopentenyl adenosine(37)-C2)-methylthiotransferase MiaB [Soehngenia saccharolytica]|nr:tRNA (N6-isopentenyl adenosine(37)-C2)-methylthiotransferase MiaB [Soehngenia saccharolytica]